MSRADRLAGIHLKWDGENLPAEDIKWLIEEVTGMQTQNEQQAETIRGFETIVEALEERLAARPDRGYGITAEQLAATDPKQMNLLDMIK